VSDFPSGVTATIGHALALNLPHYYGSSYRCFAGAVAAGSAYRSLLGRKRMIRARGSDARVMLCVAITN